jgi:phosphoribosyl-ATP pyrophosphohydrolase
MLIPSIDLLGGEAVQLRNGRERVLALGDPRPIIERFAPLGEIAVIDLDAAFGTGSNAALVRALLDRGRCRVGGGIRTRESALAWLDAGAERVILGTAAEPELLSTLPRARVIAAVDARDGAVVVEGWRRPAGESVAERIERLRPFVGGFLATFVETEGTLGGFDLERARAIVACAGEVRVTFAGGIVDAAEVAALDALGADAQVGMALYTGRLDPADALWATLVRDRADGLVPTIVCDASGRLLMVAHSDRESLRVALAEGRGVYRSRRRGLWRKGATSGATQRLLAVDADCDRDVLRFTVEQEGAACHTGAETCFGPGRGLAALWARLRRAPSEGSYTARLLADSPLLVAKLREEAEELIAAASREEIVAEAADVLYFLAVRLRATGVSFAEVERELDRRALRVTRRGGERKPIGRGVER